MFYVCVWICVDVSQTYAKTTKYAALIPFGADRTKPVACGDGFRGRALASTTPQNTSFGLF